MLHVERNIGQERKTNIFFLHISYIFNANMMQNVRETVVIPHEKFVFYRKNITRSGKTEIRLKVNPISTEFLFFGHFLSKNMVFNFFLSDKTNYKTHLTSSEMIVSIF